MLPRPLRPLLLLLIALGRWVMAAEQPAWERVEVPTELGVELAPFGGPDLIIAIRANETSTFQALFARPGDVQLGLNPSIFGGFESQMVPRGTTKSFKKEQGRAVDGRLSQAYLVYENARTGLQVYFYDTLDTRQNHTVFLVVPATLPEPPLEEPVAAPADPPVPTAASPAAPDPSDPRASPRWSRVGDVLLSEGQTLSEDVRAEAQRWKLPTDTFVEERAWIEKQRRVGAGREAEYEAALALRQTRRGPAEQQAVQKLRAYFLH